MKPFYKINPDNNTLIETNLVYTPYTDSKRLRMCFDHTSAYQTVDLQSWLPERPYYTKEMVKFFFEREVKYIISFKNYAWAPQNIVIDNNAQTVEFDFPGETCNQIVYGNRQLTDTCPDWQEQMQTILQDIVSAGYYKTSLYPHCYFIDNGILRTFDFYGCVEITDPYVKLENIRGMIGETSGPRFESATQGDTLNLEIIFKEAMRSYVQWPNNVLPKIYKEIFHD